MLSSIVLDLSFIDKWENVSPQEIEATKTLKVGIGHIFENIPPEHILSIYLKGSFYQREMNEKSDVDVSVVVDEDKYLDNLYDLQKRLGNSKDLNFGFGGYSISELRTGRLSTYGNTNRANTGTLARMIPSYALIYGKALDTSELHLESNKQYLENYIEAFSKKFFPSYEAKEFDFGEMLKRALWLFELECAVKNQKYVFTTWKNLASYFDKDHLVHEVLELRKIVSIDDATKGDFLRKLKSYLDKY